MTNYPTEFDAYAVAREASERMWSEYDSAAEWCAKRGLAGKVFDRLPDGLSVDCYREIVTDPDAFQARIRECAYELAQRKNDERST